jgi:5'-methylthioadenosine phosphorylase
MAAERLALIGGHSILGADPGEGFVRRRIETEGGAVELFEHEGRGTVLLQRHGFERYTTAARIDHPRNLAALAELECDRILAVGSVGGLRSELGVGTFLCPDDFIALHLGLSLSGGHGGERVPGFDREWRATLLEAWRRAAEPDLIDGGVYWQAIGPRFETPAEIRLIAAHAEVIGMTIASECIIAGELGIPYAAVCVVDNLANGLAEAPLSVEEFEAGKAANRLRLIDAVDAVAEELAREGVA